ncbi:hypothetical protein OAG71_03675 [bacterium]|nr:hypothetical protein [bacterium]
MSTCNIAALTMEKFSVLKKIRRTGFLYLIGIVINRIVPAWLFRFRQFVVYEIDASKFESEETGGPNDQAPPLQISWCETNNDLQAVQQLTYTKADKLQGQYRIAQAKSGQQLAGALWGVKDCFVEEELGTVLHLNPNQIWLFAALVDGAFRRQGIYAKVLGFMVHNGEKVFSSDDDKPLRYLLCVNPHNIASNRVHRKYSKAVLGQAFSLKVARVAICLCFGKQLSADSIITWDAKNRPISLRIVSL